MSTTPIPTPPGPQGDCTVLLRIHLPRGLIAAAALLAGAAAAFAQDPADEWKSYRDGLPKVPEASSDPAFLDPELFNIGYGPLRFRSQSLFQSLRLGALPDPPTYLPQGHWEFRETFEWSRMWARTPNYFVDFDTWSSSHSIAYGYSDRTQIEMGVVQNGWSRGKLDGFVRGFHRTFGLDEGGRDQAKKGEFALMVRNPKTGEMIVVDGGDQEEVSEQLVFSLHTILTPGGDELPAVAWTLTAKSNLKDSPQIDGDGIEFGTALSLSKALGDFHGYSTVGFAWYGNEAFRGMPLKTFTLTIITAVEWRAAESFSVVVQHQWTQGAVRGLNSFSAPSFEISVGGKLLLAACTMVEVSVAENLINFDNSPDFGLHTGLTIQF